MMRSNAVTEVLNLIGQSPGRLSWYQLDRSLSSSGLRPPDGIMALLPQLEAHGLIRSVPGAVASQPCYELTDTGEAELAAGPA